ncbi:hypothetical protein PoB_007573100 [Plakobranchus ocellatus]|uniref:Uncharacterized protein n=1 Tax=Plakobranchus ocellatus TaxID=259542 RepID=A0AAV4DZH1_9GAST|nr:hypothetical protein PoB_007573100 [Plakobranchus ocellatus]
MHAAVALYKLCNWKGYHDLLSPDSFHAGKNRYVTKSKEAAKKSALVTFALNHIDLNDFLCDFESKTTQKKLADHIKNRIHPLLVENKRAVEKPGLDSTIRYR